MAKAGASMFERVIEKVSTVQELAIAVSKWPSFRLVLCIHYGDNDYLVFERNFTEGHC